jgi:Mg-chelatase subunit ChlD
MQFGVVSVVWVSVIVFITAIVAPVPDETGTVAEASSQAETQAAGAASSKSSAKGAETPADSASTPKKAAAPASPTQEHKADSPSGKSPKAKKKGAAAGKKAAKSNRDAEVRVLTQEETKKRRSAFLQSPGSSPDDRYGEDTDWYELPPWRKTTFFGLRARGQFYVYVVDCSGSMLDDDRLTRATIEIRRSGGPRPRTADLQAKNQLLLWLRLIEPDGGTDPRPAMKQALSLKPDAVFLLSDGEFPQGTVDEVAKLNTRKIPIHCVDLAGGLAGDHLKKIAEASGGQYASRPGSLHAGPPSRTDRP